MLCSSFSQITSVSGIWFFITVRSSSIVWSFHSRSGYIGVVIGARRGFTFGNSRRVFTLGYSPYHQVCFNKGIFQWSRVLQVLGHVLYYDPASESCDCQEHYSCIVDMSAVSISSRTLLLSLPPSHSCRLDF